MCARQRPLWSGFWARAAALDAPVPRCGTEDAGRDAWCSSWGRSTAIDAGWLCGPPRDHRFAAALHHGDGMRRPSSPARYGAG